MYPFRLQNAGNNNVENLCIPLDSKIQAKIIYVYFQIIIPKGMINYKVNELYPLFINVFGHVHSTEYKKQSPGCYFIEKIVSNILKKAYGRKFDGECM